MNDDEKLDLNDEEPLSLISLFCLLMDKKEFGAIKRVAEALFDVGADKSVPWELYRIAAAAAMKGAEGELSAGEQRGLGHLDAGRNAEAAACFVKEIERVAPTFFNHGLALFRMGRYAEAHRAFLRAVEIEPDDPEYLNLLGQSYEEVGQPAEAELTLLKSLKIDPDYALSYYDLGVILAKQTSRAAEAKICFDRAIEIDPDLGWAYYCIACLKAVAGKKRAALVYLKKAFEKGVSDRKHIAKDADLDPIRSEAAFKRLMKEYFSNES